MKRAPYCLMLISKKTKGVLNLYLKILLLGMAYRCHWVDNADWLDELSLLKFLRDYGAHFSINRMMGMESVKLRLDREQNLSFLEFNYAILQAMIS